MCCGYANGARSCTIGFHAASQFRTHQKDDIDPYTILVLGVIGNEVIQNPSKQRLYLWDIDNAWSNYRCQALCVPINRSLSKSPIHECKCEEQYLVWVIPVFSTISMCFRTSLTGSTGDLHEMNTTEEVVKDQWEGMQHATLRVLTTWRICLTVG